MAWIASHKEILSHPKTLDLMEAMGWDVDQCVAKLHRLWWWCVDYAEDGDLRKHNDDRIARAVGLNGGNDATRFVEGLVTARWLDREPYFRIHDWWEYYGHFLRGKYSKTPEKWHRIRDLYIPPVNHTVTIRLPSTTVPNRTEPNSTEPKDKEPPLPPKQEKVIKIPFDLDGDRESIMGWLEYKREKGQSYKTKGLESLWRMIRAIPPNERKASIDNSMACNYAGIFPPKGGSNGKNRIVGEAGYIPGKYAHLS
ncbi:MAG: hypothetical protein JNK54_06445 [Elusimicrobia bacterium]|nr:hypothetical protein [Elusimicrobiota bacterium]